MGKLAIGMLTALALLGTAGPAVAQTNPRVSGSESSVSTGPTCVIGGVVSDCAGGTASLVGPFVPGPVIVGVVPVVGPFPGIGFGGSSEGRVSNDVDVDRSTSYGTTATR